MWLSLDYNYTAKPQGYGVWRCGIWNISLYIALYIIFFNLHCTEHPTEQHRIVGIAAYTSNQTDSTRAACSTMKNNSLG